MNPILAKITNYPIYLHEFNFMKNGGRNALQMTREDFKSLLNELQTKAFGFVPEDFSNLAMNINQDVALCAKIFKDLKIKDKNATYDIDNHIYMTNSGVPYLKCLIKKSNFFPIRFFIYYDGINLHSFTPLRGNVFNHRIYTFVSYPVNNSDDLKYIIKESCPEIVNFITGEIFSNYLEEISFKDIKNLQIQEDWCLEEFEKRLTIIHK